MRWLHSPLAGNGIDYLEGGKGADHFGVSKKLGKGKKNWDLITDFKVGEDVIYIDGSSKGMRIDYHPGKAILVHGKKMMLSLGLKVVVSLIGQAM